MKKISILGSTGSIGRTALDVVRHLGSEEVSVVGLAAHSNIDLLEKQIEEFSPRIVALYDKEQARLLQKRVPHVEVVGGDEGIIAVATAAEAELVIAAIVGTKGLSSTVEALKAGKDIALANKEVLVSGGEFVMALAKKLGRTILPVDSEHSALFQCLQGGSIADVRRLILTASGGPFRNHSGEQLAAITPEEALRHPTWTMGPKITIDSSTLMNKGLEVIEARWLFGVPVEKIEVVIHPQSIIHSLVEYVDGSQIAQMGRPTMALPIQYAITYPRRLPGYLEPLDLAQAGTLQFFAPDFDRFSCLRLAYDALKAGRSMPCFMNGANEVLVSRFLQRQIPWNAIAEKLHRLMEKHVPISAQGVEAILAVDSEARERAATV